MWPFLAISQDRVRGKGLSMGWTQDNSICRGGGVLRRGLRSRCEKPHLEVRGAEAVDSSSPLHRMKRDFPASPAASTAAGALVLRCTLCGAE
eukprot:m.24283 g.24283  ORF g.24283 m.24283 type:complete len:92 (-) comp11188_c0_seq1:1827-2102(-)